MKEILFRARRVDTKEWVYGYLVVTETRDYHAFIIKACDWEPVDGGFDFISTDIYEVIPETVGQFTGLTDKNGKKIFEGDKVKDDRGNTGFVFYSEHFARWQIRFTSGRYDLVNYGDIGVHIFDWIYPKIELEIIGNMHEEVGE